jgi:3-oxoacyl-[acyl-carrier protein] reductase
MSDPAEARKLLSGKRAFITGASRGIGLAVARRFASEGAEIHLNARDQIALQQVAEDLRQSFSVPVHIHAFDISDAVQTKTAFQAFQKQFRQLDILVNNAGVMLNALLSMSSAEQIEQNFATNVYGSIYCAQFATRLMARQQQGVIINLGSRIADLGFAGQSVYAASKAAIDGLTRSWAKEFAADHIRVNAVHPGIIETALITQLSDAQKQKVISSITMGRVGQADEVARVVLFLASDLSSYMTGQVLAVDGGMQG